MKPRPSLEAALAIVGVLTVVFAFWWYLRAEGRREVASHKVLTSPSEIRMSLDVRHAKGPLAEELYSMNDRNGVSTASYRAVGRRGIAVTVATRPYETYDVSFFFGKLVQDGLWDMTDKPPRGDLSTVYTVRVFQEIENKSGSHRFTFGDPHYWATAREFKIHLDKKRPLPDLVVLRSAARDPRYQQIVNEFRSFGSQAFQKEVARAQARAVGTS